MLLAFDNYVKKNKLFSREDKLLLAVSGGRDSVCLFHLLEKNNYKFSVAHCNFQLRGKNSLKDELFVEKLAKKHGVPFFSMRFNTLKQSKKLKKGIQETARKLRYDWFHELLETYRFDKLLTAHHQSDNSETMLINLLRSTGISGLHGIPVTHNRIVRPLMFANTGMIGSFVKKNDIKFRLDESNLTDHYLRNALRHQVIPKLKKIEPNIDEVMFSVSSQVLEFEKMAFELIDKQWDMVAKVTADGFELPFNELHKINNCEAFLYYKLRDFGFNRAQVSSITDLENSQVGKRIETADWELLRERNAYFLLRKEHAAPQAVAIPADAKSVEIAGYKLIFKHLTKDKIDLKKTGTLFIDKRKISGQLTARVWKSGDRMQPLGMEGSKKISDILTDNKIPNSERKHQVVIQDDSGRIIALLPKVISETCKIRKDTSEILSIQLKMT